MEKLCREIPERCVGSGGNRMATEFFDREITSLGWRTELQEFEAMDWEGMGASLRVGKSEFEVFSSPYSLGCDVTAELAAARRFRQLEQCDIGGRILLLHGDIASEQIMPKSFVFYNPEEHRRLVALLEQRKPLAIACATGRNPELAGGVYPFPMFEDGDFDIPSVFMTEEEGMRLLPHIGETASIASSTRRIPGTGCNVVARRGGTGSGRIVITAHIDSKKGTPGAIDNATGVAVLLLLARLLSDHEGGTGIEIVALNGEDYYSVPGQMAYVHSNRGRFEEIILNINLDGAGYFQGNTAFSLYGLPPRMEKTARGVIAAYAGITEGEQWPQGDHSIFVQQGRPAMAVSSAWFIENMGTQEITHTPRDDIDIVDCGKLADISMALEALIRGLTGHQP